MDINAERSRSLVGTVLKRGLVAGLIVLCLVTLYVHESYVLRPNDPQWAHFAPFRWWLVPHIITAAFALVLGPVQFSTTLRRRYLNIHRWSGRIYAAAAILSSCLALYIVLVYETPPNHWVMGAMAVTWLMTTVFAWITALRRDIEAHKLWVGRSYGMTFTFVTTRFIPDVVLHHMDYLGVITLYWLLIVIALVLPDIVVLLRRRR